MSDNHGPCPHCGYCRCCGRSAQPVKFTPFVPISPYQFPTTVTINQPHGGSIGWNAGCAAADLSGWFTPNGGVIDGVMYYRAES